MLSGGNLIFEMSKLFVISNMKSQQNQNFGTENYEMYTVHFAHRFRSICPIRKYEKHIFKNSHI